jgi:hypothetical protein
MDAREEFTRLMAWLVQNVDEMESSQIKADIDMLLGTASHLIKKVTDRNAALAKQCRPRNAKPSKTAPVRGPQKPNQPPSSTDKLNTQNDTEGRSKALSSIQQGIRQADPKMVDQQQALRGYVYGAQNDEVAFGKAAKAIAR